ncbi:hypothetical protein F441_11502, partial [Phytophthora nicotianae CJ01A1]
RDFYVPTSPSVTPYNTLSLAPTPSVLLVSTPATLSEALTATHRAVQDPICCFTHPPLSLPLLDFGHSTANSNHRTPELALSVAKSEVLGSFVATLEVLALSVADCEVSAFFSVAAPPLSPCTLSP